MERIFTRGRFIWHDLMARDVAKARTFYTELMNWSVNEMDMGEMGKYAMFMNGEDGIGGVVALDGAPAEVPSHWIEYITVDDVDAACAKITTLGGTVCVPPFDIPKVGRTAVAADPSGAVFSPFRSADGEPAIKPRPPVGTFCWYECMTDDVDKAKTFYGELLGWQFERAPFPGPEFWIAKRDDRQVCGIMKKPYDVKAPSHWLPYLLVADLAASSDRAVKLGATKLMGPHEVPGIGHFAVFQDAVGAVVSLFQGTDESSS